MATELRTELQEFQEFVTDQLRNGGAELSPEDVLGEFRLFHPTPEQHAANVEAIKEASSRAAAGTARRLSELTKRQEGERRARAVGSRDALSRSERRR